MFYSRNNFFGGTPRANAERKLGSVSVEEGPRRGQEALEASGGHSLCCEAPKPGALPFTGVRITVP